MLACSVQLRFNLSRNLTRKWNWSGEDQLFEVIWIHISFVVAFCFFLHVTTPSSDTSSLSSCCTSSHALAARSRWISVATWPFSVACSWRDRSRDIPCGGSWVWDPTPREAWPSAAAAECTAFFISSLAREFISWANSDAANFHHWTLFVMFFHRSRILTVCTRLLWKRITVNVGLVSMNLNVGSLRSS